MKRIRVKPLISCLVPIVVTLVAAGTRAEDPPAVPSWYDAMTIRGFVDVYYRYDFNTPATRRAQLRAYDGQHDSLHLNLSELSLEKRPVAGHPAGFRVDLDYGPTAEIVHAAEPAGGRRLQNVGQAYFSYLAPIGTGLQFDAGQFYTPIGNEVVRTSGNWNYSRSLLFTLAEPTYHAGVRASYVVNGRVALSAHVVNGWNNVRDNNSAKSVGLQATVTPTPALSIVQTYMGGAEQTDNHHCRHLADTVITYTVGPKVTLAANYDYGQDSLGGATVKWQGLAGYVRYQPNDWFAVSSRWEWYDDRDGFTSGTPQEVRESTLTGELKAAKDVLMRIEYRRDSSSRAFFLKNAAEQIGHQATFTLGFIYAFSSGKR